MKFICSCIILLFFCQFSFGQIEFQENLINSNGSDSPIDIHAADLDGDGDMDVLTAYLNSDKIAWFENTDGEGTFGNQNIITSTADGAKSVFAADLDGDGDMDVITASQTDDVVAWYENTDGQGNFGTINIITSNINSPKSVYVADIDGDGDMDVLSASGNDDRVAWYENTDGLGNFITKPFITSSANGAQSVHAADIDGDGDMDVLSASFNDYKIAWYENTNGQGSFGDPQILVSTPTNFKTSVFAADLDGDGDMDVLSSSWTGSKSIAWYENMDGLGDFGVELAVTNIQTNASKVFAVDMDNDGDIDVLSTSESNDLVAWYENDGQGFFGEQQIISSNAETATSVFAADIDNDGDMDVLSTSYGDNKVAWYENIAILNNTINGNIQLDINANGCDNNDINAANMLIETTDGTTTLSTFSANNGSYSLFPGEGTFTTQILNLSANYSSNPVSATSDFIGLGNSENINFCIEPISAINDLNVAVYPSIDDPRPGFDTTYQIVYRNIGTVQLSGDVIFEFDNSKVQFLSASETVEAQTANTLTFDFTDLNPFETKTIDLEFNVFPPPTTNIDEVLVSIATVNPVSGDNTEDDNVFTLEQTVIGSYDPNDIAVLEGDEIFIEEADKYLHYLIRFQNTGTASAINVRVETQLDAELDWTTMQLESLSHAGRVEIANETDVSFIFNTINLADSTNDEPNSHGYIAYKIKPKSDVDVGDVFSGVAAIYFDFNPPIITNTVNTEIVEPLSVDNFNKQSIQLFPNPAKSKLKITSGQTIDQLTIIDINGRVLNEIKLSNSEYNLDVSSLTKGVYFIEIQSGALKSTQKFIKN